MPIVIDKTTVRELIVNDRNVTRAYCNGVLVFGTLDVTGVTILDWSNPISLEQSGATVQAMGMQVLIIWASNRNPFPVGADIEMRVRMWTEWHCSQGVYTIQWLVPPDYQMPPNQRTTIEFRSSVNTGFPTDPTHVQVIAVDGNFHSVQAERDKVIAEPLTMEWKQILMQEFGQAFSGIMLRSTLPIVGQGLALGAHSTGHLHNWYSTNIGSPDFMEI